MLEVLGDSVKTEEIVEGMQEEEYEHEDAEEHEHEDAEEHEHEEEADEHVWLSLKNAKMLVRVISKALQELDPDSKDIYAANADAYVKKLSALDAEYQTAVDAASNKPSCLATVFRSAIWWMIMVCATMPLLLAAPLKPKPALRPFRFLPRGWTNGSCPAF